MAKMVAILNAIKYVEQDSHTVAYSRSARLASKAGFSFFQGNFKAVICKDCDDAIQKLGKQAKEYILQLAGMPLWADLDPKDFYFEFSFSEIDGNGEFWIMPHTSNCAIYNVATTEPMKRP